MSYDFASFAAAFVSDPMLALIVILTLGATVVNGATDAPNAIATVVGTKAMKPTPAIAMAAICNFVGLAGNICVIHPVKLKVLAQYAVVKTEVKGLVGLGFCVEPKDNLRLIQP